MRSVMGFARFSVCGALALLCASAPAASGAQDEGRVLTVSEAAACMELMGEIDGLMYALRQWQDAMAYWRERADNRATAREARSYDGVNDRLNRAFDHAESMAERYDRQCLGIEIQRATFDAVCAESSGAFCEGFRPD